MKKLLLLPLFVLMFLSLNVLAQWQSVNNGLWGGVCWERNVASLNGNVYVGFSNGVYKSTNGGSSWQNIFPDIVGFPPSNGWVGVGTNINIVGETIFVTAREGTYRSTDYGVSWQHLADIPAYPIALVFVGNATDLYCGFFQSGLGVWHSTNNGNTWAPSGLQGENITYLLLNGSNLVAGSRFDGSGIYLSTNGGQNWSNISNGSFPTNFQWGSIAFCGPYLFELPSCAYNIYRTSNFGETWEEVYSWIVGTCLQSLAVKDNILTTSKQYSTDYGNTWILGDVVSNLWKSGATFCGNDLYSASFAGIFKSTDMGLNWANVSNGITAQTMTTFLVNGSDLYAGSSFNELGVYKSSDNGITWQKTNNGNNGMSEYMWIRSLMMHNSNIIAFGDIKIYLSSNNGSTWQSFNLPENNSLGCSNGSYIFAFYRSIYRSSDNGNNWQKVFDGDQIFPSPHCIYSSGANVFAGYDVGLVRSTNNGDTWEVIYNGADHYYGVSSFVVHNGFIFAGYSDGIIRSSNNGTNWERLTSLGNQYLAIKSLESVGNYLIAGSSYYSGIRVSTNNGDSWISFNEGLPFYNPIPHSIAVNDNYIFTSPYSFGVYRRLLSDLPGYITTPQTPSNLQAVADSTKRIKLSWTDNSSNEDGFKIDKSIDGGLNWSLLKSLPPNTVSYNDTGLVPFSVYTYRVYAFNSYGISGYSNVVSDTAQSYDPKENIFVLILNINALIQQNVLDQGQGNSLIVKLNAAKQKIIQGNYQAAINQMEAFINHVNAFINASILTQKQAEKMLTIANYVINEQLSGNSPIGIHKYSTEIPESFSLKQNFPNPFNPVTKIRFDIPSVGLKNTSDVQLKVYNILGKEIAIIVNEQLQPGKYEITFDGSNLATGIYFCIFKAGDYTDTKKMVLMK